MELVWQHFATSVSGTSALCKDRRHVDITRLDWPFEYELYMPKWSPRCQGVADPNGHFGHTWTMWAWLAEASGVTGQTWIASVGTSDMVGQVAWQQTLGHSKRWSVEHGTRHKWTNAYHIGNLADECGKLLVESWASRVQLMWAKGPLSERMRHLDSSTTHIQRKWGWGKRQQWGTTKNDKRDQDVFLGFLRFWVFGLHCKWWSQGDQGVLDTLDTFVIGPTHPRPTVAIGLERWLDEVKECWGQHGLSFVSIINFVKWCW